MLYMKHTVDVIAEAWAEMSQIYMKGCEKKDIRDFWSFELGREMKDLEMQSVILAKEVSFDEMEDMAVSDCLKLHEEELLIEKFTQLHNDPDILPKDTVVDIHDEEEPIRRLTKDILKRSINEIEEVWVSLRIKVSEVSTGQILQQNVMKRLMSVGPQDAGSVTSKAWRLPSKRAQNNLTEVSERPLYPSFVIHSGRLLYPFDVRIEKTISSSWTSLLSPQ